jgi:hypothetical protein
MALPEISEAELRFVEEYCKDKNGTRAALAAGVSTTYQGARQAASKVLRNWMLAATTDLTYFEVTADGRLTTAPGVPREYLRVVRKMKQTRTEFGGKVEVKTEIELRDPFGPETKLMEHYGELPPEPSGGGMTIEDAVRLRDALARRARLGGDLPGGVPVVPEGGAADGGVPQ